MSDHAAPGSEANAAPAVAPDGGEEDDRYADDHDFEDEGHDARGSSEEKGAEGGAEGGTVDGGATSPLQARPTEQWLDGVVYDGSWRRGKPHGFGIAEYPDGTRCAGPLSRSSSRSPSRRPPRGRRGLLGGWEAPHGGGPDEHVLFPQRSVRRDTAVPVPTADVARAGNAYEGEFYGDEIHGQGKLMNKQGEVLDPGPWEHNVSQVRRAVAASRARCRPRSSFSSSPQPPLARVPVHAIPDQRARPLRVSGRLLLRWRLAGRPVSRGGHLFLEELW